MWGSIAKQGIKLATCELNDGRILGVRNFVKVVDRITGWI
jgi:hypothetical protein